MYSTAHIRSAFLDYFRQKNHEIVPSSPLIPWNDPTLLFTSAGMVQFKDIFTGQETRSYKRAATSQKCLRAGGKHNDLENVGYTARHHTFFEMLGNFSFGDYFKEQAISYAWEFITKDLNIDKERLLITVYAEDEEAASIWKKVTAFSSEKIIRIATQDNFWAMGDTGPCGPCSEIFYDHGPSLSGGPPGSKDADGDRFVEIWNLVFMQYNLLPSGERISLPRPSIDTGMGLERIAAVLQGVHDNYDIDLFRRLIGASEEISGVAAQGTARHSHRVIADHLRSACFLIADGVLPSNEGRGYVLRRIMRRAMRHVHMLNCREPHMYRLVPALMNEMGKPYPELVRAHSLIEQTLKLEEERFRETLERGMKMLEEEIQRQPSQRILSGEVAFKLYDTYGFPLDLTQDILREVGWSVDEKRFQEAMEAQRQQSRLKWIGSGEEKTESLWFALKEKYGSTEFVGYAAEEMNAKVLALIQEGREVRSVACGEVQIITNQTPFYGESGGQIGDQGHIITSKGDRILVKDTKKVLGALHVHHGILEKGSFHQGDQVVMCIESDWRQCLRRNHSATHLLHASLRKVLGPHVTQKGSLVTPDRLRFDFSHPKGLTSEEVKEIESIVNEEIRNNSEVSTSLMPRELAMDSGAQALFGEKYEEEVRVVSMGQPLASEGTQAFSVELCGGTHVKRTGDIGYFKIANESGIAAGIRRIEAVTGVQAESYVIENEERVNQLSSLLKTPADKVVEKVEMLLQERRKLEQQLSQAKKNMAISATGSSQDLEQQKLKDGTVYIYRAVQDIPAKDLRALADTLKRPLASGVVVLIDVTGSKVTIIACVTDDLISKVSAVDVVRIGSLAMGGKGGGGRADFAQGGGTEPYRKNKAFEEIQRYLETQLNAH